MSTFLWPVVALSLMVGSAAAAEAQPAFYAVTFWELRPASADDGAALLRQYDDVARKADGNVNVAIGREIGRSNQFVLVEGWRAQADFDAVAKDPAAAAALDRLKSIALAPPDQRTNLAFATGGMSAGALLVVTHVDVGPPGRAATEAALKEEAAATRADEGNLRCDVLQQLQPRLNHFNVVAVWRSRGEFERYETSAHRARFRATLAPLLGALYDERLYQPL